MTPIMENQMEHEMENEMETGAYMDYLDSDSERSNLTSNNWAAVKELF